MKASSSITKTGSFINLGRKNVVIMYSQTGFQQAACYYQLLVSGDAASSFEVNSFEQPLLTWFHLMPQHWDQPRSSTRTLPDQHGHCCRPHAVASNQRDPAHQPPPFLPGPSTGPCPAPGIPEPQITKEEVGKAHHANQFATSAHSVKGRVSRAPKTSLGPRLVHLLATPDQICGQREICKK